MLNGHKFFSFFAFVDCIRDESLRASYFCIRPFCTWMKFPWCLFDTTLDY